MLVLGIDTSGGYCSVALVDEARVLAKSVKNIRRGHAEILAFMVEEVLQKSKKTTSDITKIAVCTGPGSFTGVRVGLALVKGMALPNKIPQIGISALEVWARMKDARAEKEIIAIADVRRGEVFWQKFKHGKAISSAKLSKPGDIALNGFDVVGSGANLLGFDGQDDFVDPCVLAWLGMEKSVPKQISPLYHRPPDAKLPNTNLIKA